MAKLTDAERVAMCTLPDGSSMHVTDWSVADGHVNVSGWRSRSPLTDISVAYDRWPMRPLDTYQSDNREVSDMRVTKTRMANGWLVQAFMTINDKEVIVAEDTYTDDVVDEGEELVDVFTQAVVANLRNALRQ